MTKFAHTGVLTDYERQVQAEKCVTNVWGSLDEMREKDRRFVADMRRRLAIGDAPTQSQLNWLKDLNEKY